MYRARLRNLAVPRCQPLSRRLAPAAPGRGNLVRGLRSLPLRKLVRQLRGLSKKQPKLRARFNAPLPQMMRWHMRVH